MYVCLRNIYKLNQKEGISMIQLNYTSLSNSVIAISISTYLLILNIKKIKEEK